MRAHIVAAARALARRWPTVAAVVHRELDAVAQALRDPRLDELARLIEDGRLVEARALLAALSEDLEPGHPDLVGAVWEFNMAEQAARKSTPVEVSVYRPAFNEPHGTQRLVGVAGAPMSHEEATRTLAEIASAAQAGAMSARFDVTATVAGPSGEPWTEVATFEGPEAETMAHALADSLPAVVDVTVSRAKSSDAVPVVRWSGPAAMVARLCSCPDVAPPQDGDEVDACAACGFWRVVKPSRVLPGQVWRCVGVDGELEVLQRGPRRVKLTGEVIAREADMLGLKEWTFVSGPR